MKVTISITLLLRIVTYLAKADLAATRDLIADIQKELASNK